MRHKMAMLKPALLLFLVVGLLFNLSCKNQSSSERETFSGELYQFKMKLLTGEEISFEQFKGKVILIVNTASKCSLTPQFEGLETLYKKHRKKGLVILGFPSNQFAFQEPGTSEEIAEFCRTNYGISFPMFEKIRVRGQDAHPLYNMLVQEKPFQGFDNSEKGRFFRKLLTEKFPEIYEGNGIKWNFTKFIIDREGRVVKRIEPYIVPGEFESEIVELF